jgi:lysozyme
VKAALLVVPVGLAFAGFAALSGCSSSGEEPARDGCTGQTAAPLRVCAKGPVLEGIDVSVYQGDVAWAQVKASGRVFAIARSSNGLLRQDTKFAANWPAMKQAGLVRGAYQYFRPAEDPKAQAEAILAAIEAAGGLEAGDLPPVIDVETTDNLAPAAVQAAAKTWVEVVEARIGRKPIVYTSSNMSGAIGTSLAAYPLWVAHYTTQCPSLPDGWDAWRFWQRSDKGTVPGITGAVDLDGFDGTMEDLRALTLACAPGACADAGASPAPPPVKVAETPVPPDPSPCPAP